MDLMESKKQITSDNKYTNMQQESYDMYARSWSISDRDHVVGSFDQHNQWGDYEYLFRDVDNLINKKALDFGCGPGRNLVKYSDRFKQLDGIDISKVNINNAKTWIVFNNKKIPNLYINNGVDLQPIEDNTYDLVMSTICFQHICVYDIRFNILREIYRILKPKGRITFQMGFGEPSPQTVGYYDNFFEANGTNRTCDTSIKDENQVKNDLYKIGFVDFKFYIRPTGPGDIHPNWIFFSAEKQ